MEDTELLIALMTSNPVFHCNRKPEEAGQVVGVGWIGGGGGGGGGGHRGLKILLPIPLPTVRSGRLSQ